MKGNLKKDFDFSIIVSADDLKSLNDIVSSGFKEQSYDIKTKDGGEYTLSNLDEVLDYTNSESSKIEKLTIKGNFNRDNNFFFPNFSISLLDSSVYDKSCVINLRDMEEKDIVFYSQRINEFTKRIKAPYWWLHKPLFYWITGIVLYMLLSTLYLSNTDNTEDITKIHNILILQGVAGLCMAFSMFILQKIISFLFPESCFCIGEQEKYKNKKDKLRIFIFWTIIGTIVLGVLSSIIAHFIINSLGK